MKRLYALVFLFGVVFFAPSVSRALSEELTTVFNQLKELKSQGRYAEAIPVAKDFLELAKKELGLKGEASGADWLGWLYREQGRYAEAEPLLQRVLAIDEKVLGPEHPNVAISLGTLAGLYLYQGRYAEAEPLLQRALAIQEKTLGPEHRSGNG